ncbi:MAG: M23 family metallopeptidase [candidate division NC10 bacterium]|nr:M23 family metallopeptidase [candidate division NC10 bacterium]
MARKFYTILFLPGASATARRLQLTERAFRILVAGGITIALGVAFLLFHFLWVQVDMMELRRLRGEAGEKRTLEAKIASLEKELNRMQELDRRIRTIAGLDKGTPETPAAAEQPALLGVGGPEGRLGEAMEDAFRGDRERLIEKMFNDLQQLEREMATRQQSFEQLHGFLEQQKSRLAATPSIWPVRGWLTSGYGLRVSPFTGNRQVHEGIDVAGPRGTPVVATADGIVTFSGKLAGFGNAVVLNHGFGFKTFFAHNEANKVRVGQTVKRGQIIATLGNTGYSTGPHLHYEVLVSDAPVNPMKYIIDDSVGTASAPAQPGGATGALGGLSAALKAGGEEGGALPVAARRMRGGLAAGKAASAAAAERGAAVRAPVPQPTPAAEEASRQRVGPPQAAAPPRRAVAPPAAPAKPELPSSAAASEPAPPEGAAGPPAVFPAERYGSSAEVPGLLGAQPLPGETELPER